MPAIADSRRRQTDTIEDAFHTVRANRRSPRRRRIPRRRQRSGVRAMFGCEWEIEACRIAYG